MTGPAARAPLVVIPVLSAARSTPRLMMPIRGRSSLERTLEAASVDLPDADIVVTTDDAGIGSVAAGFGGRVQVHARTATSYVGALAEVVRGRDSEIVVVLEPTHPFRPKGLIRRTAENLASRDHLDSVVCVRRFTANLWRRTADGEILALSEGGDSRDAVYFQEMVGLALAARPHLFEDGRRLGDAVGFEVVDQTWALVDVRDDTGFAVAEALADRLPQLEETGA